MRGSVFYDKVGYSGGSRLSHNISIKVINEHKGSICTLKRADQLFQPFLYHMPPRVLLRTPHQYQYAWYIYENMYIIAQYISPLTMTNGIQEMSPKL